MRVEFFGGFVMKAFNRRFLHRAVHPFDLAVGPGVGGLGEALLDAPFVAELPERVTAEVGYCGRFRNCMPLSVSILYSL